MSLPSLPNFTPNISLTNDEAVNLLISSIAMEEMGLSHIINAEGEKIQYVLGTLNGVTGPNPTIADLLNVNRSVHSTLKEISKLNFGLSNKLETVLCKTEVIGEMGPVGPTGPTGEGTRLEQLDYGGIYFYSNINEDTREKFNIVAPTTNLNDPRLTINESLPAVLDFNSSPVIKQNYLVYNYIHQDCIIDSIIGRAYMTESAAIPAGEEVNYNFVLYQSAPNQTTANELVATTGSFNVTSTTALGDMLNINLTGLNISMNSGTRLYGILYPTSTFLTAGNQYGIAFRVEVNVIYI